MLCQLGGLIILQKTFRRHGMSLCFCRCPPSLGKTETSTICSTCTPQHSLSLSPDSSPIELLGVLTFAFLIKTDYFSSAISSSVTSSYSTFLQGLKSDEIYQTQQNGSHSYESFLDLQRPPKTFSILLCTYYVDRCA